MRRSIERHPNKNERKLHPAWQAKTDAGEDLCRIKQLERFERLEHVEHRWLAGGCGIFRYGFGSLAKVLEPASLVKEIKRRSKEIAKILWGSGCIESLNFER
jgi:hypothetical protein